MAWDVTIPDTYAVCHIANMVTTPGAAAKRGTEEDRQVCQPDEHMSSIPLQ